MNDGTNQGADGSGTDTDDTERPNVEDVVDHEDNCAACGVHERVGDSRYCGGCRDALVRTDSGSKSSTSTYRVEVGVERTGVVYVEAHEDEHARQKAKAEAKDRTSGLSFARSFTNNVRSVDTESERRADPDGEGPGE